MYLNDGKEKKLVELALSAWNLLNRLPTSTVVMQKMADFLSHDSKESLD